jgi:glycosyltransferase involved in cell wall biosynthesis
MRLLHVIHSLNPATGGVAEAVRNFVVNRCGSDQEVLTLDKSSDPWIKSFPAKVKCTGPALGKFGYSRRFSAWLRDNVREHDAVIIHGLWQFHAVSGGRIAGRQNVPYFVFPHGMLDPYFDRTSMIKRFKKRVYWSLQKRVLAGARAVLFTCGEERQRAVRTWKINGQSRIVPLGVPLPECAQEQIFFERFPTLKGKKLILFLGRLHPKKGLDLLLRAFARMTDPDLHLVLAGPACSEAYEHELRALAQVCLPDSVTFTGMLAGNLKLGAFAAAEVFILPSHQENFGLAVIEALACGLPVLISDQVNIWREIQEDGAGLVAADSESGVLELLRGWLALSSEKKQAMRAAALHSYNSRFRAESAAEKFLATLAEFGVASNEFSGINLHSTHA